MAYDSDSEEGSIDQHAMEFEDVEDAVLTVVPGTFIKRSVRFDALSQSARSYSENLRGGRPGFNPWTEKSFTDRRKSGARRNSTGAMDRAEAAAAAAMACCEADFLDGYDDDEDDDPTENPSDWDDAVPEPDRHRPTPTSEPTRRKGGFRAGVRGLFRNVKLNLHARKLRSEDRAAGRAHHRHRTAGGTAKTRRN